MKTLKQIREASGGKEAYQKFFNSLLKKFGVNSPSELEGKKRKEFFNAVDKGWEGDNEPAESVKEAKKSKLRGGKGKAELDINWDGSAKDVKFNATKYKIKIKPHSQGAMISGDKQKLLAFLQGQDYAMDDEDIEDLYPEVLETYDDPDNLDPESTLNPDEVPFAKKKGEGPHDGKTESKKKKLKASYHKEDKDFSQAQEVTEKDTSAEQVDEINFNKMLGIKSRERGRKAKEGPALKGAKLGKSQPVLNRSQENEIHKIAKKHSGDMEKAWKEISKMKVWKGKGIQDHPYVLSTLRTHNEGKYYEVGTDEYKKHAKKQTPGEANEQVDVDGRLIGFKQATRRAEGQKQKGGVLVDRRTKGYREAQLRREKAQLKREEKRKAEEFAKKYPKIEYNQNTEEENEALMKRLNKSFVPETAANAVAHGGVDMAPNAGKKKKKEKLMARRGY